MSKEIENRAHEAEIEQVRRAMSSRLLQFHAAQKCHERNSPSLVLYLTAATLSSAELPCDIQCCFFYLYLILLFILLNKRAILDMWLQALKGLNWSSWKYQGFVKKMNILCHCTSELTWNFKDTLCMCLGVSGGSYCICIFYIHKYTILANRLTHLSILSERVCASQCGNCVLISYTGCP